jgi:hypothetical protein
VGSIKAAWEETSVYYQVLFGCGSTFLFSFYLSNAYIVAVIVEVNT